MHNPKKSKTWRQRLRTEAQRAWQAAQSLDKQTVFVLTVAVALMFVQLTWGSRRFFRTELAPLLPEDWHGLGAWAWWFGIQGVTGFIIPILCLRFIFKQKAKAIGLGLGDWKLALTLGGLYLPLVVIGTWILSDGTDFQLNYPHYRPATTDWSVFLMYEALFLFYWMGWEYLWRGFVLFGTKHTFGLYAIFIQMVPFALLHANKPTPEAFLSILGGIALGALVWRCRSFWIAVPIHAAQMLILDWWCTMRVRHGATGIGPDALWQTLFGS